MQLMRSWVGRVALRAPSKSSGYATAWLASDKKRRGTSTSAGLVTPPCHVSSWGHQAPRLIRSFARPERGNRKLLSMVQATIGLLFVVALELSFQFHFHLRMFRNVPFRKPGRFEFVGRIERGLVEEVRGFGVAAGAEGHHADAADGVAEFYDGHV